MKTSFSIRVPFAITLLVASAAHASFVPSEWSFFQADGGIPFNTPASTTMDINLPGGAFGDGFGTLNASEMTITGNNGGGNGIYAGFLTVAGSAFTVSVDYSFTALDGDGDGWDGAGYFINNTYFHLVSDTGAGSWMFNVSAGDTFGFVVWSADGGFGPGVVSLTNYVPAPGALAVLGLAGVAGARRRRR
jgi:uncharacterized protein (TIGR03382 family)